MKHTLYRYTVVLVHATITPLFLYGCASTQFDRALNARHWSDAASRFDADTSLQNDEHALFNAAMLHSFPERDTYDPARARTLFNRLLELYPSTGFRQAAVDHLALLDELKRVQTTATAQERLYHTQIRELAVDTIRLHRQLDSLAVRLQVEQDQSTLLHHVMSLLESDLKVRENQLHDLDAELAQLKAIDLKSPLRPKGADTTGATKQSPRP